MTEGHDRQTSRGLAADLLRTVRPRQWTKNALVLAAIFFAFWDQYQRQQVDFVAGLGRAITATILFCLASSAVYVFNDFVDAEADRRHPLKKYRPIASGSLSRRTAGVLFLTLFVTSAVGSMLLSAPFCITVTGYFAIQIAYCLFLKRVPLVDVMVIAAGFVLRAIAGAVVLDVEISPWLLLCTFLLALFLALCKRRHEKLLLDDMAEHRPALREYDERLLDQLIGITSAATVVSYSIYTLSPGTYEKFGTRNLGFTIPFVVFGIFRYLDLVYRHDKGDRPEQILLTDVPILLTLTLYTISLITVFVLST